MEAIVTREAAQGAEAEIMAEGCHFDYVAQQWVDGHDHAHLPVAPKGWTNTDMNVRPLTFCDADLKTCQG